MEKTGLEDEIRDGYEYEMTVALEVVNDKHMARASKDRTQLFVDKPEFKITIETGKSIVNWCNEGSDTEITHAFKENISTVATLKDKITLCKTVEELLALFKAQTFPIQQQFTNLFTQKRHQLLVASTNQSNNIVNHFKTNNNGTINS